MTVRAGRVVWAGGGGACVWPWSSSLDARFSRHFLVLNGTLPQRCRLSAALHRGPFFGTRCDIHLRHIFRRFADNDRPVAATVSSEIVCLLRARVLGHTINGHGNTERLHTGRLFPQGSLREQRLGTRKPAGNCHGSFVPTCSQNIYVPMRVRQCVRACACACVYVCAYVSACVRVRACTCGYMSVVCVVGEQREQPEHRPFSMTEVFRAFRRNGTSIGWPSPTGSGAGNSHSDDFSTLIAD